MVNMLAAKGDDIIATYRTNLPVAPSGVDFRKLDVMTDDVIPGILPESLDGLVYCPGNIQLKPFNRFSTNDFIEDFRLQVTGAVKVLQQAYPALRKGTTPGVVLFSTVAVGTGMPYHSLVSSSKGAVEGLVRSLAAEWAPHVRVNGIAPALTDTPLAASILSTPEKREASAQRHPMKRVGKPDDIASMAAFLLGPEASWISGQIMHVDGGMGRLRS